MNLSLAPWNHAAPRAWPSLYSEAANRETLHAPSDPRARCPLCLRRRPGERPALSVEADHHRGAVRGRQRHGLDHAHHRAVSAERTRPKRRGGEQGRREWRAGGDLRGTRRARRIHAVDGDELDAHRQSAPVQVARLRSREGFRAGRAHRQLRIHAGGRQGRTGENTSRAGRLREGQSGQAHLCERQHHRHRGGRDTEKPRRRSTFSTSPTRARRRRSTTCSVDVSR